MPLGISGLANVSAQRADILMKADPCSWSSHPRVTHRGECFRGASDS
jgi:hypothetical protein